jgi:hypothetical protein
MHADQTANIRVDPRLQIALPALGGALPIQSRMRTKGSQE